MVKIPTARRLAWLSFVVLAVSFLGIGVLINFIWPQVPYKGVALSIPFFVSSALFGLCIARCKKDENQTNYLILALVISMLGLFYLLPELQPFLQKP